MFFVGFYVYSIEYWFIKSNYNGDYEDRVYNLLCIIFCVYIFLF